MRGLRKVSKPKVGGRRFKASRDEQALQETRSRPCLLRGRKCRIGRWRGRYPDTHWCEEEFAHICGAGRVHAHHVTTKARGGADTPDNLWALCPEAHHELHTIGQAAFVKRWGLAVEQAKVWAAYKARKESA